MSDKKPLFAGRLLSFSDGHPNERPSGFPAIEWSDTIKMRGYGLTAFAVSRACHPLICPRLIPSPEPSSFSGVLLLWA